jgi:V/A-type H+/Na+-transporting ATPase subunit I
VKPFEMLTKLYGTPSRKEYDPTWLVAISFVIFFGFCIGDVGYGLVIIVAFLLMRRFLPLGDNTKNLLLVMVYGGFFAILFGVLTGSWFGYDPAKLPNFISSMQVFDSLANPIPVMVLCMVIGLVHMLAGTLVEMRDNLRIGNIADVFIGQGLVLLLIPGTAIAAALYALGVLPKSAIYIVAGSAIAAMIILGGYKNKSIPGKMFGGIYETYNTVVGWLGDTVSYLRLFALGLATFAIGWVVNTLAGMARGIAPVIGLVFMVLILLVGHTFNVTINLLGAFVHPLRLEYVEFFGKFFDGGGRGFKPLKVESKTVLIKDEAVGD